MGHNLKNCPQRKKGEKAKLEVSKHEERGACVHGKKSKGFAKRRKKEVGYTSRWTPKKKGEESDVFDR